MPSEIQNEFVNAVENYRKDAIKIMLNAVWKGFDKLLAESDLGKGSELHGLERNITQAAYSYINEVMPRNSPARLMHHPFEFGSQSSPSASPPAPDLGFILRSNLKIMLPLEAKILKTDGRISEYVHEITDNFLKCRYAPQSRQGAMLGYLLSGKPRVVVGNIDRKLGCQLIPHRGFPKRNHSTSKHRRIAKTCRNSPRDFECHHLIIDFGCD